MKKILLLSIFAFGIGYSAKAQPQTATLNDPNAPVIKFQTDTISFDTITQGTVVKYDFKFTNAGKQPLVISSATATCGCTTPEIPMEPIAPGKSAVIHVQFNSTGKMGKQDKVITVNSNNGTGTTYVHLVGTVIAAPTTPVIAPGQADPNRGAVPVGGH